MKKQNRRLEIIIFYYHCHHVCKTIAVSQRDQSLNKILIKC